MIYLDVDGVIADFEVGIRALGYTGSILGSAGNSCGESLEKFMAANYEKVFGLHRLQIICSSL